MRFSKKAASRGLSIQSSNDLLSQLAHIFSVKPNLASTIHGTRRIHQGGRGRQTALFPSRKCGGAIALESRLELAFAIELERNSNVVSYRSQPVEILIAEKRVYPDFAAKYLDGTFVLFEIKPSIAGLHPIDMEKYDKARQLALSQSVGFELIDTDSLPPEGQLNTLLNLYAEGHREDWCEVEVGSIIDHLNNKVFININEYREYFYKNNLHAGLASYLLFHNFVTVKNGIYRGSI